MIHYTRDFYPFCPECGCHDLKEGDVEEHDEDNDRSIVVLHELQCCECGFKFFGKRIFRFTHWEFEAGEED